MPSVKGLLSLASIFLREPAYNCTNTFPYSTVKSNLKKNGIVLLDHLPHSLMQQTFVWYSYTQCSRRWAKEAWILTLRSLPLEQEGRHKRLAHGQERKGHLRWRKWHVNTWECGAAWHCQGATDGSA